jgi:outer membrane biosynthesis protein TonB
MLFMRTFTFWFILALSSFLFILFVYYKNSQRTNKPLNFIFLAILFIAIFASSIGTWWYSFGRKPKLVDQAKTVATQAKNVAQTGATQVKNAAAKSVNLVKDKLEERKQEKEDKKQSQDEGSDDNDKGPTVGEKTKAAGQSIKDKLKRKPKTDEPAPTPETPTDKPAPTPETPTDKPASTPKTPTDKPKDEGNKDDDKGPTVGEKAKAAGQSIKDKLKRKPKTDEPTPTPEKPTDKPAPTPETPTDKPASTPKTPTDKPKDEGSDDNNKGPTVGEKAKAAGQSIKDKLKRKPKTDEPAPTPEKSTDEPASTPKTPTDEPAPTPEKPAEKPATKPNEEKTIFELIDDAMNKRDDAIKTFKTQYDRLKLKLITIKDDVNKKIISLEKTSSEIEIINDFIKDIDDLIAEVEKQLNNEKEIAKFLEKDITSIISQIKELEQIIVLKEDKKQELLKKDKAELISYINTEITTIESNILTLNNEKNILEEDLKNKNLNITRIEVYIKDLKDINKIFKDNMIEVLKNNETKTHILNESKNKIDRIEKEFKKLELAQTDLENKINFYEFLNISLDDAEREHNTKTDVVTVKNDTSFNYNNAFDKGMNLVGQYISANDPVNLFGGLVDGWVQRDIRAEHARNLNKKQIEEIDHQMERQKLDELHEDIKNYQNRETIENKRKKLTEKYYSFLDQMYDRNGNIKPLNPEHVKKLKKDNQIAIETAKTELSETDKKIKKFNNKQTKDTITEDIQNAMGADLFNKLNELEKTLIGLNDEMKIYKTKPYISQLNVDLKEAEILKKQITLFKLIQQRDKLNNCNNNVNTFNNELVNNTEINQENLKQKIKNDVMVTKNDIILTT